MTMCSFISNRYSQRQWMAFVVMTFCNFSSCAYTSLLAPLYTPLAKQKGLSSTNIGFVFGAYSFCGMLCGFICGKYMNIIGAKFMFDTSMFIMAVADVAFGFLIYIDNATIFYVVSLILRVISSFGIGAQLTARNAITAKEFLENAGSTFAFLEISIGFGLMVGPTAGEALKEYGGYTLPFLVFGSVELLAAIVSVMVLPKQEFVPAEEQTHSSTTKLLLNFKMIFFGIGVLSASFSRGFYEVALENHLQLLGLTPVMIGSLFMLRGGTFTLSSPVFGFLCDKIMSPTYAMLISALCGCIGFLLLGPVPFIPLEPSVTFCIIALALLGIGGGGELVSGYSGSLRVALVEGLPDNIVTYGLVSGLWSTAYYLGDFLGPIITGVMIDHFGFGWSTVVILSLHSLVILVIICHFFSKGFECKKSQNGYQNFPEENLNFDYEL